jgi:ribosomal protein L7/L12
MPAMSTFEEARIERLERQVAYLSRQLGIDPDVAAATQQFADPQPFGGAAPAAPAEPAYPPDLLAALESGDTIGAIKVYRRWKGVDLSDAKKAVQAIARTRR